MSSGDVKQVRELLATLPDISALSLAELRATYDQLGQQFPLPEGVSILLSDAARRTRTHRPHRRFHPLASGAGISHQGEPYV